MAPDLSFKGPSLSLSAFKPNAAAQAAQGIEALRALGRGATVQIQRARREGWITTDDAIEHAAVDIVRAAYPAIADAFERHVIPWAQSKIDAWPVRTGKSRSELMLTVSVETGREAVCSFRGRAAYTNMIKRKGSTQLMWATEVAAEQQRVARAVADGIRIEVPNA